jgi:hypothetical protein
LLTSKIKLKRVTIQFLVFKNLFLKFKNLKRCTERRQP